MFMAVRLEVEISLRGIFCVKLLAENTAGSN